MARQRWTTKGKQPDALRWDDLALGDQLDLVVGVRLAPFSRWTSWDEFLDVWRHVRVDALPVWARQHAELLAHGRAEVPRRTADLETTARSDDRALAEQMLEDALERLAEEERDVAPFAELLLRAVEAGQDADAWAAGYWQAPDDAGDEDEGEGSA